MRTGMKEVKTNKFIALPKTKAWQRRSRRDLVEIQDTKESKDETEPSNFETHDGLFLALARSATKMAGVTTAEDVCGDRHPNRLQRAMIMNLHRVGLVTTYDKEGLMYVHITPSGIIKAARHGIVIKVPNF